MLEADGLDVRVGAHVHRQRLLRDPDPDRRAPVGDARQRQRPWPDAELIAVVLGQIVQVSQVRAFLESLSLFTLAESLGGVESLVCHPGSMTHAAMTEEAQRDAGIEPTLLRLSIGIEHGADLVRDISTGLERATRAGTARLELASYA